VTLGNHAFDSGRRLSSSNASSPAAAGQLSPHAGARRESLYRRAWPAVLVVNVQGRVFMDQLDDPFAAIERELAACPIGLVSDAIMIDMHAETTSEKMAMAHFVDGRPRWSRAPYHVPTADSQILLHGTGYISDAA